jgi:GGDEF domain-containing protein
MMRSIVDFRDAMLGLTETELRGHGSELLMQLVVTGVAGLASTGLLILVLWLFRRYVTRPFNEATQAATAIANGNLNGAISEYRFPVEIQRFFDAIDILRENNRARLQLEREHRRLISDLTTMAETDALTGLLNRRAFESKARALCTVMSDTAADFWLCMVLFDVDRFTRINETHGHAAGDLALRKIADLCREVWNQGAAGDDLAMTASYGVAFARRSETPVAAALFRRADALLFQAKAAGRDRVEVQPLEQAPAVQSPPAPLMP